MGAKYSFEVGDEIAGPVRKITPARIEWYDSAMLSAATDELRQVGSNIHTDEEFAKSEGFSGVNADGMIMTNWCSQMLTRTFGMDYIATGELRTKFIRPVLMGVELHVKSRVKAIEPVGNGRTRYSLFVWCEDEHGTKLVDGDAAVDVAMS
jgi:3-hydroxybutyryl-CoA dehydratase